MTLSVPTQSVVQAFSTPQFFSLQPEQVHGSMSLPRKFLQPLPNVQQGRRTSRVPVWCIISFSNKILIVLSRCLICDTSLFLCNGAGQRSAPRLPAGFHLELAHAGYLEQCLQQQARVSQAPKNTVKHGRAGPSSINQGPPKDTRLPGASHLYLGTGIKSPSHRISTHPSPAEVRPASTPSSHPPSKRTKAISAADPLASLRASSSDEEGGDTPIRMGRDELGGKPTRQLARASAHVAELRAPTSDEVSAVNEAHGEEEEVTMQSPSPTAEAQGTKER